MVVAPDRAQNGSAARNCGDLPEGGRRSACGPRAVGAGSCHPKPAIEVITDSARWQKRPGTPATDPAPAKPAKEVITDFGAELPPKTIAAPEPQPGRSPSASACEPYREAVELGLSRGRNAMAIWQDLVDTSGFAAGYQSVRRFVGKLHRSQSPEACAVIETAAGEEAQVDYGDGPMVRDPQTGSTGARACSC